MGTPEEKEKRSRRRKDHRRKQLRDNLPRIHKDTKENSKLDKRVGYDYEDND